MVVIGNVGDDIEQHGCWVSPDMDIVTYTLAGIVDAEKGWGIRGDTFQAMDALRQLGEDAWMNLGDRDLATHLYRTERRRAGDRPTEIAQALARRLGVTRVRVLPPTDDDLQTMVETDDGTMSFQSYYLRARCGPEPRRIWYAGAEQARVTPEVQAALKAADLIVVAPSNPLASIGPILAVASLRATLQDSDALRVAVSPLVGGRSLKGPSDRMLRAHGFAADAGGVAHYYQGLMDALMIDTQDRSCADTIRAHGIEPWVAETVMQTPADRVSLANTLLERAR